MNVYLFIYKRKEEYEVCVMVKAFLTLSSYFMWHTGRDGLLSVFKMEKEARVRCRAVSAWFRRQVSDGAFQGQSWTRLAWGACWQEARWLRTACVRLCKWLKLSALWHFLTSGVFLPGHGPKLTRKAWTSDGGETLRLFIVWLQCM